MSSPLFARPSVNFLLGPLFSRKTWLALDLAVSLASGSRWPEETAENVTTAADIMKDQHIEPGRSVLGDSQVGTPKRRVGFPSLFIDEYHGLDELSRRIRTLFQARRLPPSIPFHFISLPGFDLAHPLYQTFATQREGKLSLPRAEPLQEQGEGVGDVAALQAQAASLGAQFIVFDQIKYGNQDSSLFLTQTDFSPAQLLSQFDPVIFNLHHLAESLNAAVLVLLNVPTRRARSSFASALSALGADHVLALDFFPTDRPEKATPDNKLLDRCQSGYLHFRTMSAKLNVNPDSRHPSLALAGEGTGVRPLSLHLRIHATDHHYSLSLLSQPPDYQTIRLTDYQTVLGPVSLHLLRYLAVHGEASTRVLMENVTAAVPTRVRTLIHELARDGYIICTKRGGAHHPATYALTPSGRSML